MKWIAIALAPLLALGPAGCAPTTRIVRQVHRQATVQITSDQPGTLVINKVIRGETPSRVAIPYSLMEKEVIPGTYKQGWWLLGTGLLGVGAGIGMTYWGFSAIGDSDYTSGTGESVARITMGSLGIPVGLYGLFGVIAGVYYLASSTNQRIVEVRPRALELGIKIPGEGIFRARVAPPPTPSVPAPLTLPPFDQLKELSFSAQYGWRAPHLPTGLQLTNIADPGARGAQVTAPQSAPLPAPRPGPTAPDASALSAAQLALVEKLRAEGAACYRRRDYSCALARFERAFALAPSPAMRFNLASALDKLGQPAQAARQYQRYLKDSGTHASPSALAHIQQRMKVLLPQIGRLHLSLRPARSRVTINGVSPLALVASYLEGKLELILEPGTYRLEVTFAGYQTQLFQVSLGPGQLRALEIRLQPGPTSQDPP